MTAVPPTATNPLGQARVNDDDIEKNVASSYFTTAFEALSQETVRSEDITPLSLLTICILVLRNGFTVTGKSMCFDADQFSQITGRQVALADAFSQARELMGYALRDRLRANAAIGNPPFDKPSETLWFRRHVSPAAGGEGELPGFVQRMLEEAKALDDKLAKLTAFIASHSFQDLPRAQASLMLSQRTWMQRYRDVLAMRLDPTLYDDSIPF